MALLFVAASSQYLSQPKVIIAFPPCSWALWFKPTSLTANQVLISVGNTTSVNYRDMIVLTTGAAEAIAAGVGLGSVNAISSASITVGSWFHVAAVYNSLTTITVYLNGVATTVTTGSVNPVGMSVTTLGALQDGSSVVAFIDGAIAYPAAWAASPGYALTQTDVNALYNGGVGSDPRLTQTAKLTSFSLLNATAPYPDSIQMTNWTVHGTPTVVADPFSLSNAPTVTEQAVSLVTSSSATLNGNITNLNSGGNATVYGFNYGLTTAYGSTIQSSVGSYGTGAFSLNVTGLAGGVTYHCAAFATTPGGNGFSSDVSFATSATSPANKGVVLYNGANILSSGSTSSGAVANLFDGDNQTQWVSSTNNSWAGIDCGAAVTLSQLVYSSNPGTEDAVIGCTLNGNASDPTFATPVLLATFPSTGGANGLGRANTSVLQNSITVSPGTPCQYYMVQAASGTVFQFGDLDFLGSWASGVYAQPVAPMLTPSGGNFDLPTVVTMSSLTTSASIYYTIDGSTPSVASTLYTGPCVVNSSAKVQAIAVDPQMSTPSSRIATFYFIIPSKLYAHQFIYDTRGCPMKGVQDTIFLDPISKKYYLYLYVQDQGSTSTPFANQGHNCYVSTDIRNWTYVGQVAGAVAGSQINYTLLNSRMQVYFCAATQLYVAWTTQNTRATGVNVGGLDVWSSPFPDGSLAWTHVSTYTYSSPMADGIHDTPGQQGYGDTGGFVDPVTGKAYIMYNTFTLTVFSELDPASYTNTLSNNHATYSWNVPNFGPQPIGEGHSMFYFNGTYFYFSSELTGTPYNLNTYRTGSTPIGPWTFQTVVSGVNPFVQVSGMPNLRNLSATDSGQPNYLLAYQGQCASLLSIPGRGANCFIWGGIDLTPSAGFYGLSSTLPLPITMTSSTSFTITWLPGAWFDGTADSAWSLDTVFPTVSGAPSPPTNLSITGGVATWVNNEHFPVSLFLDTASDAGFTTNVASQVISLTTAPTSVNVTIPNNVYRVRAVNANGTSVSGAASSSGPVSPPSPGGTSGIVSGRFNFTWNADLANCAIEIENVSEEDGKQPKELRRVYRQILAEITKPYRI